MKFWQVGIVLWVVLCWSVPLNAQTTVTLQDQCNCEVLKGTVVNTAGTITPMGEDLGDIYVNTNTGIIFFWDGDSWEFTAPDNQQLQNFTYDTGTNFLSLEIENGNMVSVDLSALNSIDTDDQAANEVNLDPDLDVNDDGVNEVTVQEALRILAIDNIADDDQDPNNEIELPTGGTAGQILSTDGAGVYSWTDDSDNQRLSISGSNLRISGGNQVNLSGLSSIGDNLGNHRAEQDLDMRNFDIDMQNSGSINFSSNGQKLNLSNTNYGIGVQSSTQYQRSASNFAWFRRGTHSNTAFDPGTGGTALMVLRSGRLGIGTTSPAHSIDVEGNIELNNDLFMNSKLALRGNDDWLRLNQNNNFANGVYIRSNARVDGVLQAGNAANQVINLAGSGGAYGIGVQSGTQYQRSASNFAWFRRGTHSGTAFDAGAGGTALMVLRSGRLGIGTTSPTQSLDVEGNIELNNNLFMNSKLALRGNDDWLRLNQNNNFTNGVYIRSNTRVDGVLQAGNAANQVINLAGSAGTYGIGVQSGTQYQRSANNFAWFRRGTHTNTAFDAGAGGNALMVLRSGRLGIGTTNPTQSLDVEGNIELNNDLFMNSKLALRGSDDWLRLNQNNNFANGVLIRSNARVDGVLQAGNGANQVINLAGSGGAYGIGVQSNTQYQRSANNFAWFRRGTHSGTAFDAGAGGTALMVLRGGRLGIGTTNPLTRLQVVDAGVTPEPMVIGGVNNRTISVQSRVSSFFHARAVDTDVDVLFGASNRGEAFLGSMSSHDLDLRTQNVSRLSIKNATGNVGIGTRTPREKLEVNGGNIRVTGGSFIDDGTTLTAPDYVFETYFNGTSNLKKDYQFNALEDLEEFIKTHNHLPGIQSAYQIQKEGWDLSFASRFNLEKVEELFLHTIEQAKQLETLNTNFEEVQQENELLKNELAALKSMVLQLLEEQK